MMERLSMDTLIDITARVASDSLSDLFSLKLSCKSFDRLADSPEVYKRATLRKYSMVSWYAMAKEERGFLKKCFECKNPEMLYKQGLTLYYRGGYVGVGCKLLPEAAELGSDEARFALSVVRLFSCDPSTEDEAARYLLSRLRAPSDRERLLSYRESMLSILTVCSFACPLPQYRPSNRCLLLEHHPIPENFMRYLEGFYDEYGGFPPEDLLANITDILEAEDVFPDCPECNLDMIIKRFYMRLYWEYV